MKGLQTITSHSFLPPSPSRLSVITSAEKSCWKRKIRWFRRSRGSPAQAHEKLNHRRIAAHCHASSTRCDTKEERHAAKWENKSRKLPVAYTLSGDMMVRALSLGLSVWYILLFVGTIGTPWHRSYARLNCRFVVVL